MKNVLLVVLCLFLAGAVSAQRVYRPRYRYPHGRRRSQQQRPEAHNDFYKVKFGFSGGLNVASAIDPNDPTFSTSTKLGLNLGGSLDLPISYPFALELELLYSQKGYQTLTSYGDYTQQNNFIDLPILLKIQLARNFHFLFGPQISFLTSSSYTVGGAFSPALQQQYYLNSDYSNKTILGGVIGVSFDLNKNVELRGRYAIDLQSTNTDNLLVNPTYNNQVWQIGLGYRF